MVRRFGGGEVHALHGAEQDQCHWSACGQQQIWRSEQFPDRERQLTSRNAVIALKI